MSVHAPSGSASFAACSQLFSCYPLAVTPHAADGGYPSMVLMNRAAGLAVFFVLAQARDDLFLIRSWNRPDGVNHGIRPGEPASDDIHQVITGSMPGVYLDHWTLREGIQALPAACLLTLPGVVDLAYGLRLPSGDRASYPVEYF